MMNQACDALVIGKPSIMDGSFSQKAIAMSLCFRACLAVVLINGMAAAGDGNRFAYLDGPIDPYYVAGGFPKLTTPQWVGESGVDCVVVLAIDDMRDPEKYETFLRPILDRLKKIDGRAPVSIMTNQVDSNSPRIQQWLKEGLSVEVHTIDHPCPLLKDGDFQKAKGTYDRCVDLLSEIPGSNPVAFRMPCCDSLNTPSPRFWNEIFDRVTPHGNFLQIDSSVFNVLTQVRQADQAEPAAADNDFRRYIPFPSFVNTINDYPYPYIIGRTCWELPCIVPSDWEAQNLQGPNNPQTVADLKAALDAVVNRQGVFDLVFHPHGWIRNDQVVELIDHAVLRHGQRVKFMSFRECLDRLNRHLLGGVAIRRADGSDNGIRLLDVNSDGFIDVVRHDQSELTTRIWSASDGTWQVHKQTLHAQLVRYGDLDDSSQASMLTIGGEPAAIQVHTFRSNEWKPMPFAVDRTRVSDSLLELLRQPSSFGQVALRDFDNDGLCEIALGRGGDSWILTRSPNDEHWFESPYSLPDGVTLGEKDKDVGLRWVDVDKDGDLDCLFSSADRFSLHLFESRDSGWSRRIASRVRNGGEGFLIPPFVRADGTNNGAWIHSDHVWYQNEDTSRLPDHVDRVAFNDLLNPPGSADANTFPDPLSAEESRSQIRTSSDVVVQLVASEPLVVDPVAFDWGADGRLWVVEMRDYPNGMDGKGAAGGRVKVLTDDDGDGRFDRATIFLDGLPFPSGIKTWRDGVLITAAPHILFAVDNNADNVADRTDVLYQGFPESNQQHRVNGLYWGMDGWLYLGTGDGAGTIESLKTGEKVRVGGRDLRIRPDDGTMQPISGQTQYGRCCDDFGNWFGGNNSEPIWHYVLDDVYLKRNPLYAHPNVRREISEQPGAAPVFSASRLLPRFNDFDRSNRFTSACSPMIYRDNLIGDAQATYAYVCEPVHNLVHRQIVEPSGVTFTSRRPSSERQSEFLASVDNWFRPVMVRTGPDGAIWIADMHRLVIEHPTWIPESWQRQVDIRAGDDKGRIYRVVPRDAKKLRPVPNFEKLTTAQLVQLVASPNGPQRDLAQQILLWRRAKDAIEPLKQLVSSTQRDRAPVAAQALYTLDMLHGLDQSFLKMVIQKSDWQVCRHAIRLAERFLRQADTGIGEAILSRLREDSDILPLVQQIAYSLGEWDGPAAAAALAELAVDHRANDLIVAAAMSSVNAKNIRQVLARINKMKKTDEIGSLVSDLVSLAVRMGDVAAVDEAIATVVNMPDDDPQLWQLQAISRMLDDAQRRNSSLGDIREKLRNATQSVVSGAKAIAENEQKDIAHRIQAIRLWGNSLDANSADPDRLVALLNARNPPELQRAAVSALSSALGEQATSRLLRDWKSHSPQLRAEVLDQLLSRAESMRQVLAAIETGLISADDLNARRRQQIQRSSDAEIQALAARLLPASVASSRANVVQQYVNSMTPGDPQQGRVLYQKHCGTCHFFENEGNRVGPDLAALTNKSNDALLAAILDPNRAVEDRFIEYVVQLADGRQLSGILLNESSSTVTLLAADAKTHSITRDQLESIHATSKSLMPEGLEKELSPSAMADLIAYVRSVSAPRKQFEGNQPQLADVRDDGSIRLFAIHASIYGPTLQFEQHYRNLGFWASPEDQAVWELDVPKKGKYTVTLDYACDDSCAGNRFAFTVNDQALYGKVKGTSTWDNYSGQSIGTIELPAGKATAVFRSDGPINQYLIDLRTIILEPN
jgi:putative membrane-bound dehydrogenase-like protein